MPNMVRDPKQPRVWYSDTHGWLIDTTFSLRPGEVAACVNYTRRFQAGRIATMAPGDKRDGCARALQTLSEATIKQRVIPRHEWDQDRIILSDRS